MLVVQRRLGAAAVGADRCRVALADRAVERVLGVQLAAGVAGAVDALTVGFVVGEQGRRRGSVQVARPKPVMLRHVGIDGRAAIVGHQAHAARQLARDLRLGLCRRPPGPRVAEPQGRQDVERCGVGSAVVRSDPDRQVLRIGLGVLDEDVEVAIAIEYPGVEQLVLRTLSGAALVVLDELAIRKRGLRVLVEQAHVRVGRRVVDVEIVLLDVLAVVAFVWIDSEQPLLQVRIAFVPERRREAKELVAVAHPRDAVLAPAVCLGARLVVGQIGPGVAIVRVVLPHGAPRPVRDVGPPAPPSG